MGFTSKNGHLDDKKKKKNGVLVSPTSLDISLGQVPGRGNHAFVSY